MNIGRYLSHKDGQAGTSESDLGVASLWVWEPWTNGSVWGRIGPRNMPNMSLQTYWCEYPSGTDRINEKCKVKLGQTDEMYSYNYLWRRINNNIVSRRYDHRKSPFVLGVNSDGGLFVIHAAKRAEYNSDWSISKTELFQGVTEDTTLGTPITTSMSTTEISTTLSKH